MGWLDRKDIVKKTIGVGFVNGLSKAFGFLRELTLARFLGVGAYADAFFTAWRVPSLLRRFLAEGALNAAAVPHLVHTKKEHGKSAVSQLVTALIIVLQSILILILVGIWMYPHTLLWALVPGWGAEEERFTYAVMAVRWSMIVIVPFSMSALFAGALQVSRHFFVPALSQLVFNVLLVSHIACGIYMGYHMWWLLGGIVAYSCVVAGMHYGVYAWYGFSLAWPTRAVWSRVARVLRALLACCVNYGAFELNMLVDHILVSYLPVGSQALLYYASAFLQMPLSIFVSAFSTILLPQFTAMGSRTRRQQFYLLEAIKAAIWVLLPATILMMIFARDIFATTILAASDSATFVTQAAWLLGCGVVGLIPFAINRICMNVFYSVHMPGYAGIITVLGTLVNLVLSMIGMQWFGLFGVIAATVIAAMCKSAAYLYALDYYAHIGFPITHAMQFVGRYMSQLAVTGWGLYVTYHLVRPVVVWLSGGLAWFFVYGIGMWLWIGPLCLLWVYTLYATQRYFAVRLYFLRNITGQQIP